MAYVVQSIISDTSLVIYPEYRGAANISNCIVSKRVEERYPQSTWNIDRCDGTGSTGFSLDLTKTMANLPVTINNFVQSPYDYWKQLAWTGALLITFTVLALNIGARIVGAERTTK